MHQRCAVVWRNKFRSTLATLFVGIIVDAMQREHQSEAHAEREAMMTETGLVLEEIRAVKAELGELRAALGSRQGG